ncbi:unnamed protein product [Rhizoctonia solani]|uniref:Uncharacterized protein n=1 Tax=Rhizoctonia solani TaxID=456999 RepID=A0A8H3DZU8_9AGAM|nr:unnamed protein product [Rhizoctonia solani]
MDVGPYETIDFGKLADAFPPLKPFLFKSASGGYNLNFKDDAANRLNYVLWISELVKVLGLEEPIVGIDIGTGSTAIYPLIACSINKTWRFIAADIDARSLAAAQANIEQNPQVKDRIHLYSTTQDAPVLSPLLSENLARLGLQHVTFSMCNPPFYADMEEVNRSAENKEYNPHAVCTDTRGLAKLGRKNAVLVPVAFTSDHIETLFELDHEYVKEGRELGMNIQRAESLNGSPTFIRALADIAAAHLKSEDTTSVQMRLRCPGCTNKTCGQQKAWLRGAS